MGRRSEAISVLSQSSGGASPASLPHTSVSLPRSRLRPLPSGQGLQRPSRPWPSKRPKRPLIIRRGSRRPFAFRKPIAPCVCPAHGTEFVHWVQSSLNQLFGLRLRVSGLMDRATRETLRRFQEQEGLTVDGIAGPETERALIEARSQRRGHAPKASEPGSEQSEWYEFDTLELESLAIQPLLRRGSRGLKGMRSSGSVRLMTPRVPGRGTSESW